MRSYGKVGRAARRWTVAGGLLAMVVGGLTACTTSPASAPQATVPAVTQEAPPPVVSPAASSPVASPTRPRGGQATPVCTGYTAWTSNPEVKAALEQTSLWSEVVAEAEKAAAGEPVDTDRMRQIADQTAKDAKTLRQSEDALGADELARRGRHAMALASRLAGDLAAGTLDREAAGAALAELRGAIKVYEAVAAAMRENCG